MAIKDANFTTDASSADNESWVSPDIVQTQSDGTVTRAEFEATENPDGSGDPASHMTFTEIAPDGTETVREAVITADNVYLVEEDSAFENAVEAVLGYEIPDELTPYDPNAESADAAASDFQTESAYQASGTDFSVGSEMFAPATEAENFAADASLESADSFAASTEANEWTVDPTVAAADTMFEATDAAYGGNESAYGAIDSTYSAADTTYGAATVEAGTDTAAATESAELADQQAHAQAATDAQTAADDFIAKGDYAAAAEARQVAENESWEAGDDSMLSAYDAGDLSYAADQQEKAEYYNEQQAEYAQAGDYEAAREAASNSAYATGNADLYAGGDDHTGQADAEYANMDNAVWQEGLRDDSLDNAAWNAEMGNFDQAESSLDSAAAHQASADNYGNLGEHGGDMAVYDPSSEVASGGTYNSTYDDYAAVDTGFDSSMDTTSVETTDYDTDTV